METEKILQNVVFSVTAIDSIFIQLDVDPMSKVLKGLFAPESSSSLASSSSFVSTSIKLGRVQNGPAASTSPILIVTGTDAQGSVKVVHELPVTILTPLQAAAICEPELPTPHLQVVLPGNLKTLKVACDAMRRGMAKNAETVVKVRASAKGMLEICDSTSFIRWSKLVNPPIQLPTNGENANSLVTPPQANPTREEGEARAGGDGVFSVNVDIKDLCKTMQALMLNPSHGVACILDKQCLLVYFFLQPNSSCNMSFLLVNKTSD